MLRRPRAPDSPKAVDIEDQSTLPTARRRRISLFCRRLQTFIVTFRDYAFVLFWIAFFCGFCGQLWYAHQQRIEQAQKSAQLVVRRQQRQAIPAETRISAVVMNYARPRMLKESALLPVLASHPMVDEIFLCHAQKSTKFESSHRHVKNIDAVEVNSKLGLSLRFHYCAQAQNDWVLIVDDDMELASAAIDDLVAFMVQQPHRIVGRYGRGYNWWRSPTRNGYDTLTLEGEVEVVLTKVLLMERRICGRFFHYQRLVEDMLPESQPLWNGEDIFVNLVANHIYSVGAQGPWNNYALSDLEVWEASDTYKDDDTGEHDVSGNMDRHRPWNVGLVNWFKAWRRSQKHAAYRGRLWSTAKERLAKLKEEL